MTMTTKRLRYTERGQVAFGGDVAAPHPSHTVASAYNLSTIQNYRIRLLIKNRSDTTLLIGTVGFAPVNGFPLFPNEIITFDKEAAKIDWYVTHQGSGDKSFDILESIIPF